MAAHRNCNAFCFMAMIWPQRRCDMERKWFVMVMAHKTRPYKIWHLDYPLLIIPINVCTRTSGCQWCFEPGYACASHCSQNLYPCTTLLIYQKHDSHRMEGVELQHEVFEHLIRRSKSRPPESLDLRLRILSSLHSRYRPSPSFLFRALRCIVIIFVGKGSAVTATCHDYADHIRELGTSAKQKLVSCLHPM